MKFLFNLFNLFNLVRLFTVIQVTTLGMYWGDGGLVPAPGGSGGNGGTWGRGGWGRPESGQIELGLDFAHKYGKRLRIAGPLPSQSINSSSI